MSAILERQDTGSRFEIDAVPTWNVSRSWRPTESPVEAEPGRPSVTLTDQIQAMPLHWFAGSESKIDWVANYGQRFLRYAALHQSPCRL